jgi:hypothetical protein
MAGNVPLDGMPAPEPATIDGIPDLDGVDIDGLLSKRKIEFIVML